MYTQIFVKARFCKQMKSKIYWIDFSVSAYIDRPTEKKDCDSNQEKKQGNRDTPLETGIQEFER